MSEKKKEVLSRSGVSKLIAKLKADLNKKADKPASGSFTVGQAVGFDANGNVVPVENGLIIKQDENGIYVEI